MEIRRRDRDILITTTDIHLPRRIAHALRHAWGGELDTHYDRQGYFTRIVWRRGDGALA